MHLGHHLDVFPALGVFEADAIERTDFDTVVATVAQLFDHNRLGHLFGPDSGNDLPVFVQDAFHRAKAAADIAVDAQTRVDDVQLVPSAGNRVRRALNLTDAATDTRIRDEVSHANLPFSREWSGVGAPHRTL